MIVYVCPWWHRQGIVGEDRVGVWQLFHMRQFLTCIVKCGKSKRPCVLSMNTLLFLIKCNPMIGPVNFFITTKCSANMLSPLSNLVVVVTNGFYNWPFANCF